MFDEYVGKGVKINTDYNQAYYGIVEKIEEGFLLLRFTKREGSITINVKNVVSVVELRRE